MDNNKITKLVVAAQKGDSNALNDLFNATYNDIYYFALKTLKNEDLACDITQDAFVAIIANLNKLKEPAAFMGWAKKVTFSKCTRYFDKKKEVLAEEDEDGNSIFDTVAEDKTEFIPDEALDQAEFKKAIHGILATLSEEQRSAVIMYYFDEMSVRDIAQVQDVSEGTVKSRLNYARKAIKSGVEDYEKKHNTKLHAIPFFPFFGWLFKGMYDGGMPMASATKVAAEVSAKSGVALSVGTASAATAAGTTAAVGGLAIPLGAKIAAGVLAAALAVGGVVAGVAFGGKDGESGAESGDISAENSQNGDISDTSFEESLVPDESGSIDEIICDHEIYAEDWKLLDPEADNGKFMKKGACHTDGCGGVRYEEIGLEDALLLYASNLVYIDGLECAPADLSTMDMISLLGDLYWSPKPAETEEFEDSHGDTSHIVRYYSKADLDRFARKLGIIRYDLRTLPEYDQNAVLAITAPGENPFYDKENDRLAIANRCLGIGSGPSGYAAAKVLDIDMSPSLFGGYTFRAVEIGSEVNTYGYVILGVSDDKSIIRLYGMLKGNGLDVYTKHFNKIAYNGISNRYNVIAAFGDVLVTLRDGVIDSEGNPLVNIRYALREDDVFYPVMDADNKIMLVNDDGDGYYAVYGNETEIFFNDVEGEFVGAVSQRKDGVEYVDIYTLSDGKLLFSRSKNGTVDFVNRQITITNSDGKVYSSFKGAKLNTAEFGNFKDPSQLFGGLYLQADDGTYFGTSFPLLDYPAAAGTQFNENGEVQANFVPLTTDCNIMFDKYNGPYDIGCYNLTDNFVYHKINTRSPRKRTLPDGYTVADIVRWEGSFQIYSDGSIYMYDSLCENLTALNKAGKIKRILCDYNYEGRLIIQTTDGTLYGLNN